MIVTTEKLTRAGQKRKMVDIAETLLIKVKIMTNIRH